MLRGFAGALLHCLEIELELLDPLAIELDGFFYPGDVRAQLIVATLHLVEGFAAVCVLLSTRFNFRVQSLLESSAALIGNFELLNVGLVLGELALKCAKSERVKTCGETGLFSLEPTIAAGSLGLTIQMLDLLFKLVANVGEPGKIFPGMFDPIFGFPATLLVLGYPGGFFQIGPQIFRSGFHQLTDHALLDDGITAWTKPGPQEDVHNVTAPAFVAVEEITRLGVPRDLAPHGNFSVGGIFSANATFVVVEDEFYTGDSGRLARVRAAEDNVCEVFTAELFG